MSSDGEVLFFDLETDTLRSDWPQEATFERATERMHMTVGCALWGPRTIPAGPLAARPRTRTYWRRAADDHDLAALARDFDAAAMLVMYNGARFDMTVLRKYFPVAQWRAWHRKLFDPFRVIYARHGFMVSLNELALCNGHPPKTQSGTDAPGLWRANKLDVLERYCAGDVHILASVVYSRSEWVTVPVKRYREVHGHTKVRVARDARTLLHTLAHGITPAPVKQEEQEEDEAMKSAKRARPFAGRTIALKKS